MKGKTDIKNATSGVIVYKMFFSGTLFIIIIFMILFASCKKEPNTPRPDPTDNLALDSIIATKRNIAVWEEIYITAYVRGQHISFNWSTNHGSMVGKDSVTVKYWACPSCVGINTVVCMISNEYGSISDTIMITVNP
ncbi:MAG: hypothetical protein NTW49_00545 [Bacteroidia bacterium]|nr:hypothetical protein [Bacteroidia bacterium]